MINPTVSIIIPTRNRSELVSRAIRSALDQTYPEIEVIVVDDGSDEAHLNRLMQIQSPRLTIHKNEQNQGGPYSRNKGWMSCKGEYVIFLDDDDELHPCKVESQLNKFRDVDTDRVGVITSHALDYRSGNREIKYNRVRGTLYPKILRSYEIHGIETMMIKKEILSLAGGFDTALVANQEYDLMVRLSLLCEFDYVDEILSTEHRSEHQIHRNYVRKFKAAGQLFRRHHTLWIQHGLSTLLYNYLRYLYLFIRYAIGAVFGENVYRLIERKKKRD